MTIDPTALSLLSIFGGAAITVGAGFLGAWIQGRREHKRWLRDQRFDLYSRAAGVLYELSQAPSDRELVDRAAAIMGTFQLLGPDEVLVTFTNAFAQIHHETGPSESAMASFGTVASVELGFVGGSRRAAKALKAVRKSDLGSS